jgi:toxin ParE1/3/4
LKPVEFDPDARAELDRAAADYEAEYRGRGLRFYRAVERAVQAIAATPSAGHPFPGTPERYGIRRRLVQRFPFAIAYRDLGDVVRIDAVAHTRRRPGYWLERSMR